MLKYEAVGFCSDWAFSNSLSAFMSNWKTLLLVDAVAFSSLWVIENKKFSIGQNSRMVNSVSGKSRFHGVALCKQRLIIFSAPKTSTLTLTLGPRLLISMGL